MKFVADLHLHSHYSRATSKDLNFEHLARWAQLKGVHVVGTGDIAHPGWLQEMRAKLVPAEDGLFRLNDNIDRVVRDSVPAASQGQVRFLLAGEISSIYKKHDKVRKIHNVIFAPTLESVEKIQAELEKIGNIRSDGRPILGLDSRDLLEIILSINSQNHLIPAHIWTPWFSLLGSKSGFDSVEECFEDLAPHIFALETGLSSDPPMNWRISALDGYTLVSNSDAHSPQKLAREANLFNTQLSYPAIFEALKSGDPETFLGTLEFFPEEGKYHADGHRKCGVCWTPKTTLAHGGLCSVCGKPVTVGVLHRVEMLADRDEGENPSRVHPYRSIIPLPEILSEVHRVGVNSKRIRQHYETLLTKIGPELFILLEAPLEEISQVGGPLLAEGIHRMRHGEIQTSAGFDGEYGVVKLFDEHERDLFAGQLTFAKPPAKKGSPRSSTTVVADMADSQAATGHWMQATLFDASMSVGYPMSEPTLLHELNPEQRLAAECIDVSLLIVAGPGTGKTRTLTHRVAYLIRECGISPRSILAITFTNKAAEEMAGRLNGLLGIDTVEQIVIKTFHAFGAFVLRENALRIGLNPNFVICNEDDRLALVHQVAADLSRREAVRLLEQISAAKNQLLRPESPELADQPDFVKVYQKYESLLEKNQILDFDDLGLRVVTLFETEPEVLKSYQQRFQWVSVDEYQDINRAQYRLLRLLVGPETNLCAIGDPDQAIYGFRGADRAFFLQFNQDYPRARILYLNQNYRSTQLILDASGQVITRAAESRRLELWSEITDETKVEVYHVLTEKAEAEYVVHEIEKMIGGTSYFSIDSQRVDDEGAANYGFADFAVLYRLGAQSRPLIEAFDRSGIPYQSVGQIPLTETKEIKLILAYLWLIHNPEAALYLERALPGLQVGQLAALAAEQSQSPWALVTQLNDLEFLTTTQRRQWSEILLFVTEMRRRNAVEPVTGLINQINEFLEGHQLAATNETRTARVQQFLRQAVLFDDNLGDFLETVALHRESDAYDPRADRVVLMTLHASKGLEFPVVFIVGCEEDLIPYRRPGKPVDLDEERRLFYVGMTRARQRLILTHAQRRFLLGESAERRRSLFIDDIETSLMDLKEMKPRKTTESGSVQLKLF